MPGLKPPGHPCGGLRFDEFDESVKKLFELLFNGLVRYLSVFIENCVCA